MSDTTVWRDTWWRSWLRHCATSRKVAGSIPGGVIGIFRSFNRADSLTNFLCGMSRNLGVSISWNHQSCTGIDLPPYGRFGLRRLTTGIRSEKCVVR
jgi:hypothetical protein